MKKSREKKSITCPQCKVDHGLPPQGIDGFTTFFTINNLLELLRIHENAAAETPVESIKCSSGLDENPAFARCLTCSDYLCESCYAIHQKQKMSKDHAVKTLDEIKHSDKKTGIRSLHKRHHCQEHKDKLLELYCKTCKKVICFLCALLTHKQHDYAAIHEIRAATHEKLENQVLELQTKVIEFQDHQKYTENLLKISNEAAKSTEAKVNLVCGALIQSIEARCAQLINDVHCIHESEVKQITLESESIAHSLSRFLGSIQFTRQLLDNGDDVEVMANSDQTVQTLTNLAQLEWDRNTLKPSLLRPEFDSVEKSVSNFGKVLCTIQPDDVIFSNLPTEVLTGKEYSFEVSLSKKISERGYDALADITISHSDMSVIASSGVKKNGINTWSVTFTPDKPGEFKVSVKIPGCSFCVSRTIDVASVDQPVEISISPPSSPKPMRRSGRGSRMRYGRPRHNIIVSPPSSPPQIVVAKGHPRRARSPPSSPVLGRPWCGRLSPPLSPSSSPPPPPLVRGRPQHGRSSPTSPPLSEVAWSRQGHRSPPRVLRGWRGQPSPP